VLGWALEGLVGAVIGIIECVLVIIYKDGRRMGDRWANIQVISSEAKEVGKKPELLE
jgi:hypothetical protein